MKKTRQHGGGGIPLRGIRKSNNRKKNKSSSSVELIKSSDKRFRSKVLASVGLDDDDDDDDENDINNDNDDDDNDDASYDKCDDIEEAASLRQKHHANDKRMRKKKKKNKNKSENAELINDEENDTDEDCEEYESLDHQSTSSTHRCSKLKPICNNLLWIIATIAAVIFILYDDEKLEESEIDEDVILKDQPYSYNGYKDARIPDDDVAQFGGGILYNNNNENGASGALPSNSEEEDDEDNELVNQVEVTNHHEPSGIVEVDILWEQLDGYAEMSEPLEENDLPVFWHIREYYINNAFLLKMPHAYDIYSSTIHLNLSNLILIFLQLNVVEQRFKI